jgi:hypothetical protein
MCVDTIELPLRIQGNNFTMQTKLDTLILIIDSCYSNSKKHEQLFVYDEHFKILNISFKKPEIIIVLSASSTDNRSPAYCDITGVVAKLDMTCQQR